MGTDWTSKSSSVNATESILPKGKRLTEIDLIEKRNKKPETSTPSPQEYKPDVSIVVNRDDAGLGSMGLKMRDGRTFISDEAQYLSDQVPAPTQYNPAQPKTK